MSSNFCGVLHITKVMPIEGPHLIACDIAKPMGTKHCERLGDKHTSEKGHLITIVRHKEAKD